MARPFRRRVEFNGRRPWRTVAAEICAVLHWDRCDVESLKLDEALLWWLEAYKINNPKAP